MDEKRRGFIPGTLDRSSLSGDRWLACWLSELRQAYDVDAHVIPVLDNAFRVTLLEPDARYRRQQLYPDRRHAPSGSHAIPPGTSPGSDRLLRSRTREGPLPGVRRCLARGPPRCPCPP